MVDNRSAAMTEEQLAEKATWRQLPTVKAGQTTPWSMEERFSYAGFAPVLERLAAAITESKKLKARRRPIGSAGCGSGWTGGSRPRARRTSSR